MPKQQSELKRSTMTGMIDSGTQTLILGTQDKSASLTSLMAFGKEIFHLYDEKKATTISSRKSKKKKQLLTTLLRSLQELRSLHKHTTEDFLFEPRYGSIFTRPDAAPFYLSFSQPGGLATLEKFRYDCLQKFFASVTTAEIDELFTQHCSQNMARPIVWSKAERIDLQKFALNPQALGQLLTRKQKKISYQIMKVAKLTEEEISDHFPTQLANLLKAIKKRQGQQYIDSLESKQFQLLDSQLNLPKSRPSQYHRSEVKEKNPEKKLEKEVEWTRKKLIDRVHLIKKLNRTFPNIEISYQSLFDIEKINHLLVDDILQTKHENLSGKEKYTAQQKFIKKADSFFKLLNKGQSLNQWMTHLPIWQLSQTTQTTVISNPMEYHFVMCMFGTGLLGVNTQGEKFPIIDHYLNKKSKIVHIEVRDEFSPYEVTALASFKAMLQFLKDTHPKNSTPSWRVHLPVMDYLLLDIKLLLNNQINTHSSSTYIRAIIRRGQKLVDKLFKIMEAVNPHGSLIIRSPFDNLLEVNLSTVDFASASAAFFEFAMTLLHQITEKQNKEQYAVKYIIKALIENTHIKLHRKIWHRTLIDIGRKYSEKSQHQNKTDKTTLLQLGIASIHTLEDLFKIANRAFTSMSHYPVDRVCSVLPFDEQAIAQPHLNPTIIYFPKVLYHSPTASNTTHPNATHNLFRFPMPEREENHYIFNAICQAFGYTESEGKAFNHMLRQEPKPHDIIRWSILQRLSERTPKIKKRADSESSNNSSSLSSETISVSESSSPSNSLSDSEEKTCQTKSTKQQIPSPSTFFMVALYLLKGSVPDYAIIGLIVLFITYHVNTNYSPNNCFQKNKYGRLLGSLQHKTDHICLSEQSNDTSKLSL